jgi:hypothetical protein
MKNIIIYAIVFAANFSTSLFSQISIEGSTPSDSAKLKSDFKLAIQLAKREKLTSRIANLISESYANLNNIDSSIYYFNKSISFGGDVSNLFDPDFEAIKKTKKWQSFSENLITEHLKRDTTIKCSEWAIEIMKAINVDQDLRFKIMDMENLKFPQKFIDSLSILEKKNDLQNELIFKNLINKFGYPTISKVGKAMSNKFGTVILHLSLEFQISIFNDLELLAIENDFRKSTIALLTDKILTKTIGKQLYGTQVRTINNKKEFCPIIEPQNVNERRKKMEVNLTIEEYGTIFGIKLDNKNTGENNKKN